MLSSQPVHQEKKRLLFVINTSTYFRGLANVIELCNRSCRFEAMLYFDVRYPTYSRDAQYCKDKLIKFTTRDSELLGITSLWRWVRRSQAFIPRRTFFKLFHALLDYKIDSLIIRGLLHRNRVHAIVLGADNVGYNSALFIRIGHQLGISSILIPQWMASPKEPAEFLKNNPAFGMKKFKNKFIARLFPKWSYAIDDTKLIRLQPENILIYELFHLSPPNPWVLHSGYSDIIALESNKMKEYCLTQGLPEKKLQVTGSIEHDTMRHILDDVRHNREKIYSAFDFDTARPLIVTALPPDFLYIPGGRPQCEFQTYNELITFWIDALVNAFHGNILISLHPSVHIDEMRHLEQRLVKIGSQQIINYIPLCDLFVASISSTIQWAITCAKPVLNYDVYKFDYEDYTSAPGVYTVTTKKQFQIFLDKFSNDPTFTKHAQLQQQLVSGEWGQLDGKSYQRLFRLFNSLPLKT